MVVAILGQDSPSIVTRFFDFPPCVLSHPVWIRKRYLHLHICQLSFTLIVLQWREPLQKHSIRSSRKLSPKFPITSLSTWLSILLSSPNCRMTNQSCLIPILKGSDSGLILSKLLNALTTSCSGHRRTAMLLKRHTSRSTWYARLASLALDTCSSPRMAYSKQETAVTLSDQDTTAGMDPCTNACEEKIMLTALSTSFVFLKTSTRKLYSLHPPFVNEEWCYISRCWGKNQHTCFWYSSNRILENDSHLEIRCMHLSAKNECVTFSALRDRAWLSYVCRVRHCISLPVLHPFAKQCLIQETCAKPIYFG